MGNGLSDICQFFASTMPRYDEIFMDDVPLCNKVKHLSFTS